MSERSIRSVSARRRALLLLALAGVGIAAVAVSRLLFAPTDGTARTVGATDDAPTMAGAESGLRIAAGDERTDRHPAAPQPEANPSTIVGAVTVDAVEIELVPLRVHVTTDGAPTASAHVVASASGDTGNGGPATHAPSPSIRDAFTDDEGRAQLALPPGSWRLVAERDGRLGAVTVELVHAAREEVEIRLGACIPVEGRVVSADNLEPLPGAVVWVLALGRGRAVRTDASGAFQLPAVPANGRAQAIHFERAGHGIESAWVLARPEGDWTARLAGVARDDGDGAPGPDASAPGPDRNRAREPERPGRPALVALMREGPLPPAVVPDVALVSERVIRGRFVDTDGAPVAEARAVAVGHYRVRPGVSFPDRSETRSAADGTFELRGLRSDVGHTLRGTASGFATFDLRIPADAGPAYDCGELRLTPAIEVHGLVLDAEGRPEEGVRVTAVELERALPEDADAVLFPRDEPYAPALSLASTTDARGAFAHAGLRHGGWRFTLESDGRTWVRDERVLVPGPPLKLVLELPPDAPAIEGRVLHDGAPVAGATVVLAAGTRRRTVTSDADGRFHATGVAADTDHELRAVATGPDGHRLASDPRTVRAGGPVVLELRRATEVEARGR